MEPELLGLLPAAEGTCVNLSRTKTTQLSHWRKALKEQGRLFLGLGGRATPAPLRNHILPLPGFPNGV